MEMYDYCSFAAVRRQLAFLPRTTDETRTSVHPGARMMGVLIEQLQLIVLESQGREPRRKENETGVIPIKAAESTVRLVVKADHYFILAIKDGGDRGVG